MDPVGIVGRVADLGIVMRIVVVSHTPHHRSGDRLVGWGPTVRELDRLAGLFDELVHVAPVHEGPAPASELPYEATNVRVAPVRPAGGERLLDKLAILRVVPEYVAAVSRELSRGDVAHVRCPSNIGLVASLLLAVRRKPTLRWIKYAGNWRPQARESRSYGLQRWLLERNVPRAFVTVNGEWPGQPPHVHAFMNPCLTQEELGDAAEDAARKALTEPVRLLFVGRLEEEKGTGRAIEVLGLLRRGGTRAVLEIVGDGPSRAQYEYQVSVAGLGDAVRFHGWLPRQELASLYRGAHFLLLPSNSSEGWPKVLSEGMAYGVVPITSNVSSIPQLLESFRTGRALPAENRDAFAAAITAYLRSPEMWGRESQRAAEAARAFSYDAYLDAVRKLLSLRAA
jgi:glycosyltransferase involved in cell wall biosynthesis